LREARPILVILNLLQDPFFGFERR
jgi:hypothetical protein